MKVILTLLLGVGVIWSELYIIIMSWSGKSIFLISVRQEISELGEVLMLSHVRIEVESGDKKERLLLFFPGLLVVLSVTSRVNGYIYEVSQPL